MTPTERAPAQNVIEGVELNGQFWLRVYRGPFDPTDRDTISRAADQFAEDMKCSTG